MVAMGGRKEGEKVVFPVEKSTPRDAINWLSAVEMERGVMRVGAHRVGATVVMSFALTPDASECVDIPASKKDRIAAWILRHRVLDVAEIRARCGITNSVATIDAARKLLVRGGQIKKDHGIYVWTDRS